jgi:hypothetical protein
MWSDIERQKERAESRRGKGKEEIISLTSLGLDAISGFILGKVLILCVRGSCTSGGLYLPLFPRPSMRGL